MKTTDPVNLLVSRYIDPNPVRNEEIVECLRRNIANPHITAIHLFDETNGAPLVVTSAKLHIVPVDHRVKFEDFFRYANQHLKNQTCLIANSDVFFDFSLAELQNYNLKNTLMCLSRWDERPDGSSEHFFRHDSQDAWIFLAPVPKFSSDWNLGIPGCENRLAFEAKKAGMKLRNPSRFIRARHLHMSEVRHYTEGDRLKGGFETVPIDEHRPMKSDGIAVSALCLTTYPKRSVMLDEAIASFLAQSFPSGRAELVIVNDGTPIRSSHPSIIVSNTLPGKTIGEKRNIAAAIAQGQALATFDDDDISLENRFEDQFRILNDTGAGLTKSESLWVADGNLRIKGLLKSPSFGTSMVRADVLKKVGGFPHTSWAEDMEMFIRVVIRKIPVMIEMAPMYIYRKHGNGNISFRTVGEGLEKVVAMSDRNHPSIPDAQARVDRIVSTKKTYIHLVSEKSNGTAE